jgi:hypothetical protein
MQHFVKLFRQILVRSNLNFTLAILKKSLNEKSNNMNLI